MSNLDPSFDAAAGIPADAAPADAPPTSESAADDQPLDDAASVAADVLDEDTLPLGDVATIIGDNIARTLLFGLGDAVLEGKLEPLNTTIANLVGVLAAVMEGPAITALREIRAREDQEEWDRMIERRSQVVDLLGAAKAKNLSEEAIMYLLHSLVEDYSKEPAPGLVDRVLEQALPVLAKLGFDAGYKGGGCGDCGRRGWNVAPGPSPAPAGGGQGLADAQEAATHIPYAYGVPSVSPQAAQFAQAVAAAHGRGMTHADVAAAYGTSSIPPNGFMPPGAIPVPFQTMIGNHYGLGHQGATVTVEGVNRTVEIPGANR